MSSANVEIVKRGIDAFHRLDLDGFAEIATLDIEIFPAMMGVVEGGSYRGREGVETWYSDIRGTWEEHHLIGNEFRDLGDRVLWLGRVTGRGKGSGVPVDAPMAMLIDIRGDKISRMRSYLDHGEALRAAGLAA
jgi:ketosteroid isomerase-like protein